MSWREALQQVVVYQPPPTCEHAETRPVYAIAGTPPEYLFGGQPVALACTSCSALLPIPRPPLLWEGDQA